MPNTKGTRKNNGDGSIFQINENKWVAKIQVGTNSENKPIIKSFSAKTETLVKKKLKEFKRQKDKFLPANINSVTFIDYIDNWLYSYKKNGLKPTSFDRLESTINTHIKPNVGLKQLSKLTSTDIQEIINKLFKDEFSHSTIKKVHDAFNSCLSYALIKGDIEKNPMLSVSLPSKEKFVTKQARIFTEEELGKIICELNAQFSNDIYKYKYRDAYILILNTGLRMGECLGILKSDINLKEKTLHIQRNVAIVRQRDNEDDITEVTGYSVNMQNGTKTYAGDRIIDLNKNALLAINNMIALYPDSKMLMQNRNGNIISPINFIRSFNTVLTNVGIEPCGLHSLRHTFASFLFKKGISPKTVSDILGHSSTKITLDTYIHLIREQKTDAMKAMDDIDYGKIS